MSYVTRPEKSSDVNDVSGGVEMGGSVAKEKLSSLTEQGGDSIEKNSSEKTT